jgi:hypothetical protein
MLTGAGEIDQPTSSDREAKSGSAAAAEPPISVDGTRGGVEAVAESQAVAES